VLTDSMDAFSQQYGFNTIAVTGLTIEACRLYRKRAPLPTSTTPDDASPAALANVVPDPNLAATTDTPASDLGAA